LELAAVVVLMELLAAVQVVIDHQFLDSLLVVEHPLNLLYHFL
jgi:hypothetical protein